MVEPAALPQDVAQDAAALVQIETPDEAFYAALADFTVDAEALSQALRAAGASDDLPCIFHGIAEDARVRAHDLQAAETADAQSRAMNGLRALLNDAITLAPFAAEELTSP
jgi:hypothetical protein